MKLKLLLFLFLLPFVVNAANTNVFDRVLIRNNFQFAGGTPGSLKVLSSDAAGNASWVVPGSGSLLIGQTSLGQSETWLGTTWANIGSLSTNSTVSVGIQAGRNSTFGHASIFLGNGAGNNATFASNSVIIGRLAGSGAANAAHSIIIGDQAGINDTVNNLASGSTIIIGRDGSSGGFKNSIAFGGGATNTVASQFLISQFVTNFSMRGLNYVMPSVAAAGTQVLQNDGSGNLTWATAAAGTGAAALTNAANFFTSTSPNTFNALVTASNLTVIGTTTNGSSVFTPTTALFGFNSSFIQTYAGVTHTAPNGAMWNSGVLWTPQDLTGTATNGTPLVVTSNLIVTGTSGITTYGSGTDTNLVINGNNGSAFIFLKGRLTMATNILGSVAVINTWFTNPTQQRASVSAGVVLPSGALTYSQVGIWTASNGLTNKYIMSSFAGVAGSVTNSSPTAWINPGGSIIYTNLQTAAGTPSLDNIFSTTAYH